MIYKTNFRSKVEAPFRLDLVMGGVSDLSWWDSDGECLSLSCAFSGSSISLKMNSLSSGDVIIVNFDDRYNNMTLSIDTFKSVEISNIPDELRLIVSAISVSIGILNTNHVELTNGFIIENCSSRAKGMGGSSVLTASVISLICKNVGNIELDINDIISATVEVEKIAGIGGGWEDIAGICYPGINWVKYFTQTKPHISIEKINCNEAISTMLNNRLLVVDSRVKSSTACILESAEEMFNKDPLAVKQYSNYIMNECGVVVNALLRGDIDELGLSFTRQRGWWNKITNGVSSSKEVDMLLEGMGASVMGYREAGAGGGGTVLIICYPRSVAQVSDVLCQRGAIIIPWQIATFGLNVSVEEG